MEFAIVNARFGFFCSWPQCTEAAYAEFSPPPSQPFLPLQCIARCIAQKTQKEIQHYVKPSNPQPWTPPLKLLHAAAGMAMSAIVKVALAQHVALNICCAATPGAQALRLTALLTDANLARAWYQAGDVPGSVWSC